MNRIDKLRGKALNAQGSCPTEFYYYFYKKYAGLDNLPEARRYAEAFYYAMDNLTPNIDKYELIVGKCAVALKGDIKDEWDEVYFPIAQQRRRKAGGGQDSHMAIDYEMLLKTGVNGIIEKIDKYISQSSGERCDFYLCCKRCLEAVIKLSAKYSEAALRMSEKVAEPGMKKELINLSAICKRVPAQPAETFHEAVQSVHFISHCLSLNPYRLCAQQFQLGRPDRYLLPYYENDIKNGTITEEHAQLLLDCLGLQINMRVQSGLSCGYMIGGRDRGGKITANALTKMCMRVIEDVRLVYPAVGFCYADGMPEELLDEACRLLCNGRSHPAIFNDNVITRGLISYGVPENEAHDYIQSTCVEITPIASSNVWVATPYTNMVSFLLSAMDKEYPDFDSLIKAVTLNLDRSIKKNYEEACAQRLVRAANSMNPLLSCFVNDCLERGRDIENGGARYNWILPSFVGMANLTDSLYAVKTLVFDEKSLTLRELKAILDSNFESNEALRLRIINDIPKYGNDIDDVDKYFGLFTEHIANECKKYECVHTNGNLIPSVFCWIMHEHFGKSTQATPDGRKAGFPLGDGSGPCQGRELNGPTASVLSSTKWDHSRFIGGVAVNMKFSKASLGANSSANMKGIIKAYMHRGGFEMQINVVDKETLEKARVTPEEYKDLLVRIGGYSDYFVRLSANMQEELILRTEHNV